MRPILIGTDNPHSADPALALSPYIPRSTGWRLWKMLNDRVTSTFVTFSNYEDAFQRANICDLPVMVGRAKKNQAVIPGALIAVFRRAGTVVLLGDRVRKHFALPKVLIHPVVRDGVCYRQVPHPSGRCRFYNDPVQRELVAVLLEDLYREAVR